MSSFTVLPGIGTSRLHSSCARRRTASPAYVSGAQRESGTTDPVPICFVDSSWISDRWGPCFSAMLSAVEMQARGRQVECLPCSQGFGLLCSSSYKAVRVKRQPLTPLELAQWRRRRAFVSFPPALRFLLARFDSSTAMPPTRECALCPSTDVKACSRCREAFYCSTDHAKLVSLRLPTFSPPHTLTRLCSHCYPTALASTQEVLWKGCGSVV